MPSKCFRIETDEQIGCLNIETALEREYRCKGKFKVTELPEPQEKVEIEELDETWDNKISMAYGSVYKIAMENRKMINRLIKKLHGLR